MMGLTVDRDGAARALAMAGARHWPAHLGERPEVEAVADPELRSRLSAWAMATLALVGCEGAVNVDRAQVAALGERLRAGEYYEEEPEEEGETNPKRFPGYAMVAPVANSGPLAGPGAADTARVGEDSGTSRSETRDGNARDGEQARPVLSPESRPVLPEVLSWLREQGAPQLGSPGRRAHMAALGEAVRRRTEVGVERYGVPLHSHAGRDAMRDLGEELVDAVQYATQALMENESDYDAAAWLESVRYHAAEAWCDLRRVGER